ncbi:hypothetical protein [Streptomyces sp. NPDC057617]|uniref:hypothetical protein n=1 Tax=Streptomyces sp. NPDC057617 TaxID=3346184 RepID=UPI00368EF580
MSTPAELVPLVLDETRRASLTIDYLVRESACAATRRPACEGGPVPPRRVTATQQ